MIRYIFVTMTFTILSCNFIQKQNCQNHILKSNTYQCHNPKMEKFSFLSKYKNLEVLDLSKTGIKDISFLKDLKKLKFLILNNTKIKNIDNIKYLEKLEYLYIENTNIKDIEPIKQLKALKVIGIDNRFIFSNKNFLKNKCNHYLRNTYSITPPYNENNYYKYLLNELNQYKDFIFSLIDKNIQELDLFMVKLQDIRGLTQLKELKKLNIFLKNDKYINVFSKLDKLSELHLAGNIKNLPRFTKLEKLYLYNGNIKNFSFIDNINYLFIVTKSYENKSWNLLKKRFPFTKIKIKNRLFSPTNCKKKIIKTNIRGLIDEEYGEYNKKSKHFYFNEIYLNAYRCSTLFKLKENSIYFNDYLSLLDYKFLLDEINIKINHLWDEDTTFLDKAIEDKNIKAIKYLKSLGAKQGCKITKEDCEYTEEDIKDLLNSEF